MPGRTCIVTRRPGAPPRRAGREWAEGETRTELADAELRVLSVALGYEVRCEPDPATDGSIPPRRATAAKPPAGDSAGRGKARPARKTRTSETKT
jgi:hypothetical protein